MVLRFQEILKRGAGESLENWNVPFFRVGGAGTHYPRLDDQGKPMYPPNMHSPAKAFGPAPSVVVETPRDEKAVAKMLEAVGFDGEWFDSHDVEQYLRELGIRLDGHSTFIDIDPALGLGQLSPMLASDSSSEFLESPIRTPPATIRSHNTYLHPLTKEKFVAPTSPILDPTFASEGFFPMQDEVMDLASHYNEGATSNRSTFPIPSLKSALGVPKPSRAEPVTMDVQRLLDSKSGLETTRLQGSVTDMFLEMVDRSVCLGRAPGFRRTDIDAALSMAMLEAF